MGFIKKYIGDLQIGTMWYLVLIGCAMLFFISFFVPLIFTPVLFITLLVFAFTIIDYILLFIIKGGLKGNRIMGQKFSIGDNNTVGVSIINSYPFKIYGLLIDELPEQFQERNFSIHISAAPMARAKTSYTLRPTSRGEYGFGSLLCYVSSPLGLLQRRFELDKPIDIKVYPAYQQLKKYQLQLLGNNESRVPGLKRIRRLGHSLEFEKIKDYVAGDDVRTINWKATARTGNTMVNTYTDARQQQIYCIIDKGRAMKMPFEGITLLDYSINASLALLNVALLKQDKAGLITFANKINDVISADRRSGQLNHLLEALYKQNTAFNESDYESLWITIHKRITQRSFLLIFTNFETYSSMERQLPYLKKMSSYHLVCIVFFRNTLLKEIQEKQPDTIEGIYIKTIAERFDFEKRQIVKELRTHGILSILTTPEELTVDVINKYLELKARQMV